jgi:surfeit locus 1 family protein
MAIAFRFRWLPFCAMLVVVAVGLSLGQWQMRRADEKEAIEKRWIERTRAAPFALGAQMPAIEDIEYRRLVVRGEFQKAWPIYLDNRPYQGRAGFYLLMPFRIAGSDRHVLVARGWLARDAADRQRIRPVPTPDGMVEIHGVARRNSGRVLELGEPVALRPGAIVQNVDLQQLAQASGLSLHSFVVEQIGHADDGLVREWPHPSVGVEKHLGYAFQWFALAATAFIFFLVTGIRHGSK